MKGKEFGDHLTGLTQVKTEHDARLAAVPKEPKDYKFELPKDFKAPEGWALDDKHPLIEPFRAYAHKRGMSQEDFSAAVQMFGEHRIAETKLLADAKAVEDRKLGANGTARVTAVKTWLTGIVGDKPAAALIDRMVLASDIEAMEQLQRNVSSQGRETFNNNGRERPDPPKPSIEDRWYPNMQKAS